MIASGLRPFYTLEEMQGRRVIVMANMKTRNMGGFKSEGMVREDPSPRPLSSPRSPPSPPLTFSVAPSPPSPPPPTALVLSLSLHRSRPRARINA